MFPKLLGVFLPLLFWSRPGARGAAASRRSSARSLPGSLGGWPYVAAGIAEKDGFSVAMGVCQQLLRL